MKNVLKTIVAAIGVAMSLIAPIAVADAANAETIKIGVAAEPYPPFTVPDASGGWSGWEIDFLNAICEDQHLDCKIVPVAWDGIIPALVSGQIDAIIASMGITAEREKTIAFSNSYYKSASAFVAPKSMKIDATPESFAGKIVGVQASSIYERYAQENLKQSTIKTYQTQDEVYQDLVAGRIDVTLADQIAAQPFLTSSNGECCEVKRSFIISGKGVGVGLRKGDEALKAKFDKGISNIRADGTYGEITKKYFDFDIYGD